MNLLNKVGIMGGTFNPVHNGHIALAQSAYKTLALDKVLFMPSGKSYMKNCVLDARQRIAMIDRAISPYPYFELSTIEVERAGNTYTSETLQLLNQQNPQIHYYFIMGADSLFQIETWHEPAVIMADCIILAAMRNHTPDDVFKKQMDYLEAKYHADIRFLNIPDLALSSSEIRRRVREHQSIRFMVPEGVREYIEEHQLYCR